MEEWEARYAAGETPWDGEIVSPDLVDFVTTRAPGPRALEIGCGTGTHAVWLAARGFSVVALDISPTAVGKARARAAAAGVSPEIRAADALAGLPSGFNLVFDRGVLHGLSAEEGRRLADRVHAALVPGGWWLSLLGSSDEPSRRPGPPRWSLAEIAAAMEPRFRVERVLTTSFDDTTLGWSPRAWRVEARPR